MSGSRRSTATSAKRRISASSSGGLPGTATIDRRHAPEPDVTGGFGPEAAALRGIADDRRHMRAALALARRALGIVAPNPAVGCVLVREGRIVGRGWTQPGGRPHAETEALARAGDF